jgi:erythromycin esterase-like protein
MRFVAVGLAAMLMSTTPFTQTSATQPIASLTSPDFSDLTFLKPLLSDVRIVQLGEAGHGMGEVNHLKVRLARFLIQEMGFTVVAFESSLYLAHQADMRARDVSAQTMLTSSLIGVWHTKEVLPLFEQLKASRGTSRELRLAGFDVQPIGSGKKTRPAFLRRLLADDPAYAAEVEAFDTAGGCLRQTARGKAGAR